LLEGGPTTLIEGGRIRQGGLAKELLTQSQLLMVAHRQGFSILNEIGRYSLEPGGGFFIQGKKPPTARRTCWRGWVASTDNRRN
jgi:uncharacterized membrane protein YcaP (DUF421 family)